MGVPSYFAWLVRKQANILSDAYPNRVDILYLDLNCAIHPAVKSRPMTYEEMPEVIWQYLLNIVQKVNPCKTLYIAIDGVAPVGKMKQQRARRYKSVLDKELKRKLERKYGSSSNVGEEILPNQIHDFNMISPGTQFMLDLSQYLETKIRAQRAMKPIQGGWSFKVILSDASVPMEGEHKIMKHIREQTNDNDNIIVYGLDSDLIFLTLCNYRSGIALFREKQFFEKDDESVSVAAKVYATSQAKVAAETTSQAKVAAETTSQAKVAAETTSQAQVAAPVFRYLSIDLLQSALIEILNPYTSLTKLAQERILVPRFHTPESLKAHDDRSNLLIVNKWYQPEFIPKSGQSQARRLVLDYIFMCFLLGNDFLPSLPSLTIRDGGLDQLLIAYKITQVALADFLVDSTAINQKFLTRLFLELAKIEEGFLQQQTKASHARIANHRRKQETIKTLETELADQEYLEDKDPMPLNLGFDKDWQHIYYQKAFHSDPAFFPKNEDQNEVPNAVSSSAVSSSAVPIAVPSAVPSAVPKEDSKIMNKYDPRLRIIETYLTGLQWTLNYYHGQPVAWDWVYPFEHGPLVSDMLRGLNHFRLSDIKFPEASWKPASPLEQLLQILPSQSSNLLPESIGWLMTDNESGIIHMYPTKVDLDINFKRWRWEAHPILPTIDRELLRIVLAQNLENNHIAEVFNRVGNEMMI